MVWKLAFAVLGSKGTEMPICWPGLAEGAVATAAAPLVARTSLAGRIVKWRTRSVPRMLPALSLIAEPLTVSW